MWLDHGYIHIANHIFYISTYNLSDLSQRIFKISRDSKWYQILSCLFRSVWARSPNCPALTQWSLQTQMSGGQRCENMGSVVENVWNCHDLPLEQDVCETVLDSQLISEVLVWWLRPMLLAVQDPPGKHVQCLRPTQSSYELRIHYFCLLELFKNNPRIGELYMWVCGFLLHDRRVYCWPVPLHWHWMPSDSKNVRFNTGMGETFAVSFRVSKDVQAFSVHRCTDIVDKAVSSWANFSWSLLPLIHSFSHLSAICNRSLNLIRPDFSDSLDTQLSRNWKPGEHLWPCDGGVQYLRLPKAFRESGHLSQCETFKKFTWFIYMFVNMSVPAY